MMHFIFIGDLVKTMTFKATAAAFLQSSSATYANAVSGTGVGVSDNFLRVGQVTDGAKFEIWQAGLGFDTSALSGKTLQTVKLIMTPGIINPRLEFYVDVYPYDYGAAIDAADWRNAAALAALTPLVARKANATFVSGPNEFESTPDFLANVNTTGLTKLWLASSENIAQHEPYTEQAQFVSFYSIAEGDDELWPQLVVTYI